MERALAAVAPDVPAVSNDSNYADRYVDLTDAEKGEVRQSMEYMGITIRRARKILRAYGGGKYLRRGIGAALALNFQFTSLEQAERALTWIRKMYKNKDLPVHERVEMVKAMASILESVRRLSESSLSIAEKFDVQEKEPQKSTQQPINVGVSISNYPPVATMPARTPTDVLSADRDRAL